MLRTATRSIAVRATACSAIIPTHHDGTQQLPPVLLVFHDAPYAQKSNMTTLHRLSFYVGSRRSDLAFLVLYSH